ncbi:OmpA family protein [Galbibacter pacificus]|uniref:OmpA family protein n=1 Tax=Galbibacter pacificus TaxID=2996052 RepID=A0ABT6FRR7_9FLAO|nr:OmpA family protein [Galbibacter pacificus]MDG3582920.1 OmpA family protein [Galbibacter pacificus]MDG3585961.1 OmpA family protein [Galbibacter pacificus]
MNIQSIFALSAVLSCSILAMAFSNSKQKECSFSKKNQSTSHTYNASQDTIPLSTADLGDFPFFGLPKNTQYVNKPMQRDFDEIYFPVSGTGKLEKISGRSFKAYVTGSGNSEWNQAYFKRSYDEAIKEVGGVKLFEGKFSLEHVKFMKENAEYLGEEGSLDFYNNPIHSYIIRRPDGEDVYIQFDAKYGAIQILQKEAFRQTIGLIKADQIEKDLNEKGKSILYINFDTDKATLKPEGKTAIWEIGHVLKNNTNLKMAVHGYTDNIGNQAHNITLSEQRAQAVVTELASLGISKSRLTAEGFGSQSPIADNTTPEGRAKNRRVELIKK